mmetsp:Transcript_122169/g.279815  ORF Transcript_122169/g.279815 Transcript_122169/m.279815 type:complete len:333 (+) Transcript_122169:63-1061(+)
MAPVSLLGSSIDLEGLVQVRFCEAGLAVNTSKLEHVLAQIVRSVNALSEGAAIPEGLISSKAAIAEVSENTRPNVAATPVRDDARSGEAPRAVQTPESRGKTPTPAAGAAVRSPSAPRTPQVLTGSPNKALKTRPPMATATRDQGGVLVVSRTSPGGPAVSARGRRRGQYGATASQRQGSADSYRLTSPSPDPWRPASLDPVVADVPFGRHAAVRALARAGVSAVSSATASPKASCASIPVSVPSDSGTDEKRLESPRDAEADTRKPWVTMVVPMSPPVSTATGLKPARDFEEHDIAGFQGSSVLQRESLRQKSTAVSEANVTTSWIDSLRH